MKLGGQEDISKKGFARELSRRARRLRDLALEELKDQQEHGQGDLLELHRLLGRALVRQSPEEFAGAYAQTLTFGLLAARWMSRERGVRFTKRNVVSLLPTTSPFLTDLLDKLLHLRQEPRLDALIGDLVSLLDRTAVEQVFRAEHDPFLHFYEDFLDEYDPRMRKDLGVYYTPSEVVAYMVRATHDDIQQELGLALGLADPTPWSSFAEAQGIEVPEGVRPDTPFVQILDPAAGTGTFLARVFETIHGAMREHWRAEGLDEASLRARWVDYVRERLLPRVSGFEVMMAPYVVAHLRLGMLLEETGFTFGPRDRLRIFLTNTLEVSEAPQLGWIGEHVAAEATEAERLKRSAAISIIVGNPPYDRLERRRGGWVLRGWAGWREGRPLLQDYLESARVLGAGFHLKNLYNLYVYFFRWATWKVFESHRAPGVVCLITPSSYLRGPGFVGMRAHLRGLVSRIDVLDLEGDRRGSRVTKNVFCIRTPVCIAALCRAGGGSTVVRYFRVEGTRADKLAFCATKSSGQLAWHRVADVPGGAFMGGAGRRYQDWPRVTDLFPWQHSGAQFKRTWPIAFDRMTLTERWRALVEAKPSKRASLFHETRDRRVDGRYLGLFADDRAPPAIVTIQRAGVQPRVERYGFRSFDRQWCLADARLGDFLRPALWQVDGRRQVYLTSLLSGVLGDGPAATVSAYVPDLHHFRGSFGGKDVIPLWRDREGMTPNVCAASVRVLEETLGLELGPADLFAYAYAILANPGYVARHVDELRIPGPRLPLTKDPDLFAWGAALGRQLLRLHTYGERLRASGDRFELRGAAACLLPVPGDSYPERYRYDAATQRLSIGGGLVAPVDPLVWSFSVSGFEVVKSWLDYRMKGGRRRRSSPLDDFHPEVWKEEETLELLELLWLIESTIPIYPELDALLDAVLRGDLFAEGDLRSPTEAERMEPKAARARSPGQCPKRFASPVKK